MASREKAMCLGALETRRRTRTSQTLSLNSSSETSMAAKSPPQLKHQISFLLNNTGKAPVPVSGKLGIHNQSVQNNLMPVDGRDPISASTPDKAVSAYQYTLEERNSFRSAYHHQPRSTGHNRPPSERRRTCDQCGKIFAQPADLKKHIKCVHLKERPFQCDHCSAAFGEKGNLNRHKRSVHNKERPWVCLQCGLPFAFRDTLTRHIRAVHQDIRPFSCSFCHSAFKKRDHLHRHQEAVHGIEKRIK